MKANSAHCRLSDFAMRSSASKVSLIVERNRVKNVCEAVRAVLVKAGVYKTAR